VVVELTPSKVCVTIKPPQGKGWKGEWLMKENVIPVVKLPQADIKGPRIFQYDDIPHHPELSTYLTTCTRAGSPPRVLTRPFPWMFQE
jgi:hypothetical protein